MEAAIAAGHPASAAAGLEILADGGSAADAIVAASLASCVAETVMTGLLGGGHAVYWDAGTGRARNLDCFVAVPGLGAEPREPELVRLEVPPRAARPDWLPASPSCGSRTAVFRGRGWSSPRRTLLATASSFRPRTRRASPCSRRS